MTITLLSDKRRTKNLRQYEVETVLPAYFQESYPNLVLFLSKYYDQLYTNGEDTAIGIVPNLFSIRDLDEISLRFIDRLFYEIANGSQSKYFNDPRLVGKFFHQIIQNKGNEYSTQMFFRAFFGETPDIVYPKQFLFTANVSKLNDQHVLQNGAKWQILSVLIRSGVSIVEWESLYRKFVHTAGYYLSGEVVIETVASMNSINEAYFVSLGDSALAEMPISIEDSDADTLTLELSSISNETTSLGEMILRLPSWDSDAVQGETFISSIANIQIDILDSQYDIIADLYSANSPTFDEWPTTSEKTINMSSTVETMDESIVTFSPIVVINNLFIPSGANALMTNAGNIFAVLEYPATTILFDSDAIAYDSDYIVV